MACNWTNWTGMWTHYRRSVSSGTGIETYMISYFNFEMNHINLNAFITCAVWRTFLLILQIGHCHGMFLIWVKHMTVMGVLHSLLKPSALTGEVTTTSMQFVRWGRDRHYNIHFFLLQQHSHHSTYHYYHFEMFVVTLPYSHWQHQCGCHNLYTIKEVHRRLTFWLTACLILSLVYT